MFINGGYFIELWLMIILYTHFHCRFLSPELAIAALIRCEKVCQQLLERAKDGSSSSRLILQLEVIHLIDCLFTDVLPLPKPPGAPDANTCKFYKFLL